MSAKTTVASLSSSLNVVVAMLDTAVQRIAELEERIAQLEVKSATPAPAPTPAPTPASAPVSSPAQKRAASKEADRRELFLVAEEWQGRVWVESTHYMLVRQAGYSCERVSQESNEEGYWVIERGTHKDPVYVRFPESFQSQCDETPFPAETSNDELPG